MVDQKTDFNEDCWIIYEMYRWKKKYWKKEYLYGIMVYESEGSPGSVDFDWEKVVRRAKRVMGFSHTHPGGYPSPSSIDDNTMIGWVKALGKPLVCGIESKDQLKIYLYERVNGKVEFREVPFKNVGRFIRIEIG